jgi:superfamily II DNA/RNA helicase
VETLHEHFASVALRSDMIHGGLSQRARQRALDGFRQGRTQVLVATDVAARGIHVDGVDLVLQLDVPQDHKDYLHRAGRTARAGARGTVVTFVAPTQQRTFARLLDSAGVAPEFDVSRRPGRPRRYGSRDAR